mmetsp:Transcript_44654/g.103135  ORF Transcript_44654/g.103135 Transcript_44654/m.103135 type:complete len:1322 (+) Transcript_44654:154-4119(+)
MAPKKQAAGKKPAQSAKAKKKPQQDERWRALIAMQEAGNSFVSSVDHRSDKSGQLRSDSLGSAFEGEDAIFAMAVLLRQRLQEAPSLSRFVREDALEDLEAALVRLITQALGSPEACPRVPLTPELLGTKTEGLVQAIMDTLTGPHALGEDLLVSVVDKLQAARHAGVKSFLFGVEEAIQKIAAEHKSASGSVVSGTPSLCGGEGSVSLMPLSKETLSAHQQQSEEHTPSDSEPAEVEVTSEAGSSCHAPLKGALNTSAITDLKLPDDTIQIMQRSWDDLISIKCGEEGAADVLYSAILQSLSDHEVHPDFTTPKSIHGVRFVEAMGKLVSCLEDAAALRAMVETLGFSHMQMNITDESVMSFATGFLSVFEEELGYQLSIEASEGWIALLTHVGGAIIFVKSTYGERIKMLLDSWESANDHNNNEKRMLGLEDSSDDSDDSVAEDVPPAKQANRRGTLGGGQTTHPTNGNGNHNGNTKKASKSKRNHLEEEVFGQHVPSTFAEMFEVNAVVMGFTGDGWLRDVLQCFDAVVKNIANAGRLQEECDVLAMRMSKREESQVKLDDFKSCMLASLRSLLPKEWSTKHEEAWGWLWSTFERMLKRSLDLPKKYEKALVRFFNALDEDQMTELRRSLHPHFFAVEEVGQRYFKQSNTRLNYIAGKILEMTGEFFKDPISMVERLSALGLRHVGYGSPTELFAPFAIAGVSTVKEVTADEEVIQAFRWSLGLIAKILTRTVKEGSTIVMTAINSNSTKALRKALSSEPRGERARSLLVVQVGTQSISPLAWAIESGVLEGARAIITDLLTIRADRERYYYGAEELFTRHPNLILMLSTNAPGLLPTLLEGLIWRARHTTRGVRRVNFYVKYLLVEADGSFSKALEWLAAAGDLPIISHPVICLVSDLLWKGVVRRLFIFSKVWPVVSLLLFIVSQTILPRWQDEGAEARKRLYWAILVARSLIYLFTIPRLGRQNFQKWYKRRENMKVLGCIRIPAFLKDKYAASSMVLLILLLVMCCLEPLWWCTDDEDWPTDICPASIEKLDYYQFFGMTAMVFHWLILVDLSIFSTKLASFVIVCGNVLSEVLRFLIALSFLILTFASGISVLTTEYPEFQDVPRCVVSLFALTVSVHEVDYRDYMNEPVLLSSILLFVVLAAILLLNLLIAQLNCSYEYVYQDAVGFARLGRASLVIETVGSCPRNRWDAFVEAMHLDQNLEFDEGDIGVPGGIQVSEPSSLHPVVVDSIHRFGGECSPDNPWPEDDQEEEDKYEQMQQHAERILQKVKRISKRGGSSSESRTDTTSSPTKWESALSMGPAASGVTKTMSIK